MMTSTRRAASPARLALTASGFREPRACDVKVGHGYYIGASSSPTFVLVIGIDDDMVRYIDAHSLTESRVPTWIFADLACSALATLKKDEARTHAACTFRLEGVARRLAQDIADMCNYRVLRHGHAVEFADFDKVECRVSAPDGVDVYGLAKSWGVVGDWDSDANKVSVECDRSDIANLAEAGLTIESTRLVKACPVG
jgi:hypothetical protein